VPKRLNNIQVPVTIIYPSLFPEILSSFLSGVNTMTPVKMVISEEYIREEVACSSYKNDTPADNSIKRPSTISIRLKTLAIMRKLTICFQVKNLESFS
jgi:hypothetical protein